MAKSAEIFCIGTEVLIGDIVNSNAAYISKRLSENGINVYHHTVCGDNPERIKKCLDIAFERSDIVVTTGGLGPTYDDITKEIIAEKMGLMLVENKEVLEKITTFFKLRGRCMTGNNLKQALIPETATVFPNKYGTADGIAVEAKGKIIIMLPGPPREMKPLLEEAVIPYLRKYSDHVLVSSNVNIFGMGESAVESELSDLMKDAVNPTAAPYINNGEVRIRVTASANTEDEAWVLIKDAEKKIIARLEEYVFGIDEPNIETALVKKLKEKNLTISFAESCTGGLISKRITDISGASEVFGFGFVTYANEAKMKLLGVKEETLAAHGAVSHQTAYEMAEGAKNVSGADIAISVTGIAGPTGGTEEKPVGTVFMGVSTKWGGTHTEKLTLGGHNDREYIRTLTAAHAYKAALDEIAKLG